jgi:hypothetical protein
MRLQPPDQLTTALMWTSALFMAFREGADQLAAHQHKAPLLDLGGWWGFFPLLLLTLAAVRQLFSEAPAQTAIPPAAAAVLASHIEEETKAKPEPPADRVFLPKGFVPESLMKHYKGQTAARAKAVIAPYIGKWVRLDGALGDLDDRYENSLSVWFHDDATRIRATLSMHFAAKWKSHLETMQIGDPLSVMGRISSVDILWINLDDCEIVPQN